MPDIRSAAKFNGIPISGLLASGATLNVYRAVCSGSLTVTTTETDVAGTSMSVVVPSASSLVLLIAYLDMDIATNSTVTAFLNWDGSDFLSIPFTNARTTLHYRGTFGFSIVPTISGAGTFTAKLRASSSSNASDVIRSSHTTLTALVVSS